MQLKNKIVLAGIVATFISMSVSAESAQSQINRLVNAMPIEKGAVISERVGVKMAKYMGVWIYASAGYKCDSISSAVPKNIKNTSFSVKCNNYRYAYNVKDHGGQWIVEVDD